MKRYVAQAEAIFSSDKEGVGDGMGGTENPDSSTSTTLPGGDQEAESMMDEVAPPGMEDLVMKLKKKYGAKSSSPFAIAWAQYNKSHKSAEGAVNDPAALAAWIGRKKYGKDAYQKMAAKGRKHSSEDEAKRPKLGTGARFKALVKTLSRQTVQSEALHESHMSPQLFQQYVQRYAEVGTTEGALKGWKTKKSNSQGIPTKDIMEPWGIYKGKYHGTDEKTTEEVIGDAQFPTPVDPWTTSENEGKFVVQAEAIEAIGMNNVPQLGRKGDKNEKLVTPSGTQDIPIDSFKDDLNRKVSLRKMMSPDKPKKKDKEAIEAFNESYR